MGQYFKAVVLPTTPEEDPRPLSGSFHRILDTTEPSVAEALAAMATDADGAPRVWWMGNWADGLAEEAGGDTWAAYERAWNSKHPLSSLGDDFPYPSPEELSRTSRGYLVDGDGGTFVDLSASLEPSDGSPWPLHPLPLLTVVGNGLYYDDYRGSSMELVGAWAGHRIRWSRERPEGLRETVCRFAA